MNMFIQKDYVHAGVIGEHQPRMTRCAVNIFIKSLFIIISV